jgi:predicted DCC family thiol-disulfide oxidoreductase YuxK
MNPMEIEPDPGHFILEVFYDGGCPLCRREMDLLKRWDRRREIRFSDISDPAFDPKALGKTVEELMARMHGRLPDGTWVEGVEVFRRLYAAVGFGPIVWLTRFPVLSHLLDFGYAIFARHRLRLTGRCTTDTCSVKRSP